MFGDFVAFNGGFLYFYTIETLKLKKKNVKNVFKFQHFLSKT